MTVPNGCRSKGAPTPVCPVRTRHCSVRSVPAILLMALILLPSAVSGQEVVAARAYRLDLEALYLTGARLWPTASTWRVGAEIGLGLLEQKTFSASDFDFQPLVHVGLALERPLSERFTLDVSVRIGYADLLRVCGVSDCLFESFRSVVAGVTSGRGRVAVGTHISVARQSGETLVAWSPLSLRVAF